MFSDMNKHFSCTIVCIHYMSGHWKLSLDFLRCLSNEKLNLKEWWYQGALPLLSLVWETKSLNTPLCLYLLTISRCLGNFFMWSFRRLSSGGKVWGLSTNPSTPPDHSSRPWVPSSSPSEVPATRAKRLLYFDNILFYFTERLWYSRQLLKNWSNSALLSYVTGKD